MGNQAGVIESSLKEGTGLAGIKCSNKKASNSTIQATSSPRNRLTTLGTHLACCAHGTILHLGDQTEQHELCYADLVLWQGTCFPFGSRQSQGPRLSEATQNGRLKGAHSMEASQVKFSSLLCHPPSILPGAVWSTNEEDLLPLPVPSKGCSCHHCHIPPQRFKVLP